MLAGEPYGIVQSEVAGSVGDFQRSVEKLAGRGRGIDVNHDGGRVGAPTGNRADCDTENPQDFGDFHCSFGPSMIGVKPHSTANNYDYSSRKVGAYRDGA